MQRFISQLLSTSKAPLASFALLCTASVTSAQTTWMVDDNGPNDPFPGVSIPNNPTFSDPAEDGSAAHPFDDIYKAVSAASSGDTVLVEPSDHIGFYALTDTLDLDGKNITLRSTQGAGVTVLDGAGIPGQSGVLINSNETSACVIEGLTFSNFDRGSANGNHGGAMFISAADPVVRNCIFTNNKAYRGGGAWIINSDTLFENCGFFNNPVVHQGGAFHVENGTPRFNSCTFQGNTANFGGAVLCRTINSSSEQFFTDCLFFDNHSFVGYSGGMAKFDNGNVHVRRSRFVSNTATVEGGGLLINGPGTVENCTFNSNEADNGGGLFISTGSTVEVIGSTFTNNIGGACAEGTGVTFGTMSNCIVWNNAPFELSPQWGVNYSTIMGGYAGSTNLDVDPLFADAWGQDGVQGTLDDDLSLLGNSPCIDAGDTRKVATAYPVDLVGNTRAVDNRQVPDTGVALVGQSVDMGAFEFQVGRSCNEVITPKIKLP